jgi:hypothetical protein
VTVLSARFSFYRALLKSVTCVALVRKAAGDIKITIKRILGNKESTRL